MDTNPGDSDGKNGDKEPTQPPAAATVAKTHKGGGQERNKRETITKRGERKGHVQSLGSWFTPDKVQAISAVVQAICAAALVFLTLQLWRVTSNYKDYTGRQASAEETSANAAKRSANAEATSAANETRTLRDEEGHAKDAATNFSQQLQRLDASIRAANDLATAAKRSAQIAKDTLLASESQFIKGQRPYMWVQIKYGPDFSAGRVRLDVQLVNLGKSPAIGVVWRHHLSVFTDDAVPVGNRIGYAFAAIPSPASGYTSFIPATGQPIEWQTDQTPNVLTDAQLNYVKTSAVGWVEAGFVTYRDSSGKRYTTKYCYPGYPGPIRDCGDNTSVQ